MVWTLLHQIPMIAGRHSVAVVETLHTVNDLGQDAAEAVPNGNDTGAVILRRVDVQPVKYTSFSEGSLQNVKGSEFSRPFETQAALDKKLGQRPIPEPIDLIGARIAA